MIHAWEQFRRDMTDWLKDGYQQSLQDAIVVGGKPGNLPLRKFKVSWSEEDLYKSEKLGFLAILCRMDNNKLVGRESGVELCLNTRDSVLWSRPGVYISNQSGISYKTKSKRPRTHYVGEGKNLAARLMARGGRRKEIFSEGAKLTLIIKDKGIVNDDWFFVHEVRTTAERFISEKIESKLVSSTCNNKPSWCLVHEKGLEQLSVLTQFVEELIDAKHIE